MHELSIAHSILSIAERALPVDAEGHISAVQVQVGELSTIETESLLFAFNSIREGTVLSDAELQLEIVPGRAECRDCHTAFHLPAFGNPCPACGSYDLQVTAGREMKVLSITVGD